jgi:polar amino acid transport system substrate-binding protein
MRWGAVSRLFRFLVFSIILSAWTGSSWAVTELRTVSQDAYPKYYMENGQISGICPAILKAIERADPNLKFVGYDEFLPTKRIDKDLLEGKIDTFACFAPREDRKAYLDFIEPPLFTNAVRVAVLKSSPAARAKSWEELVKNKDWVFLATMGTPHVEFLQALFPRLNVDPGSGDNQSNMEKLQAGRGQVFVHFDYILKALIKKGHLEDQVIVLPFDVRKEKQYFVVSKKVPTVTKEKIAKAIQKLKNDGELQRIHHKFIVD